MIATHNCFRGRAHMCRRKPRDEPGNIRCHCVVGIEFVGDQKYNIDPLREQFKTDAAVVPALRANTTAHSLHEVLRLDFNQVT